MAGEMSRKCLLTDEQAQQLRQDYFLWLSLCPKKLQAKYGVSQRTFIRYAMKEHKTRAT